MSEPHHSKGRDEFRQAARTERPSLIAEFVAFLRENKKWWLLPILVAILVLGALVFLSGTAVAPFVYTLF